MDWTKLVNERFITWLKEPFFPGGSKSGNPERPNNAYCILPALVANQNRGIASSH